MNDVFEIPTAGLDPKKTTDLLLINSPLRPDYDENPKSDYEVLPPIGEAYLASAANDNGHNVGIVDAEHHGLGIRDVAQSINNRFSPRIVGINILTPSRESALAFAEELNPNIPLVIGGAHATALPERTLTEFCAVHPHTLLIQGEAEVPMVQLLNGDTLTQIPGLWRIDNGNILRNNITQLHTPPKQIPLLNHAYLANDPTIDHETKKLETKTITSRGCPFDCTFCAGSRSSIQAPVRNQPIETLIHELTDLFNVHGSMGIRFIDDLFIASENRVRAILDGIENAGLPLLYWDATGRANLLSRFSEQTLDYLKDHGAHELAIGIESGSERIRAKINKRVSEFDIMTSVAKLTQRGIKVKGYLIVGLPTESTTETMETFRLAKTLVEKSDGKFRASIFVFRPYPGTHEWNQLINQGYSIDQLLGMYATGSGERAKHIITTNLQFAEIPPQKLNEMITDFEKYQQTHTK